MWCQMLLAWLALESVPSCCFCVGFSSWRASSIRDTIAHEDVRWFGVLRFLAFLPHSCSVSHTCLCLCVCLCGQSGRERVPSEAVPARAAHLRDEEHQEGAHAGIRGAQHRTGGGVRLQRLSGPVGVGVVFFFFSNQSRQDKSTSYSKRGPG